MALALRRPYPHPSSRARIGATSGAVCLLRHWLGFSTKAVVPTRARASAYESAMAVACATTTDCIGDLGTRLSRDQPHRRLEELGSRNPRGGRTERNKKSCAPVERLDPFRVQIALLRCVACRSRDLPSTPQPRPCGQFSANLRLCGFVPLLRCLPSRSPVELG